MDKQATRVTGARMGAAVVASGLVWAGSVHAQGTLETLAPLTVVGNAEQIWNLAGSAAFVDAAEIRRQGYFNVNRVFAKVPGVYVREEDGFGNFPNISLRGADGTRSEKVTLMEDGVLTAPSPYSAPAAYYTPKVNRMAGIEVLKGSSQVKYGPQTTGGVVNFLSTPIPSEAKFFTRNTVGSFNTLSSLSNYGATFDTEAGRLGYLMEVNAQQSDGFREIGGVGGDTGFKLFEPMLKLSFEPKTALQQRFEFKLGYTEFDTNESYAGLTEADLAANPDRRYAATQFDELTSEQLRSYLKWTAEPSAALRLESAAYFNSFSRSWDKLDQVNGSATHQQLLVPGAVQTLRGLAAGTIRTGNNIREHEAFGWQNQANFRFTTGAATHDLAAGLRLHYDEVAARQIRNSYTTTGGGPQDFVLTTAGANTYNGYNEAFATAVFLEDKVKLGALTLTPGVRYEFLELEYTSPTRETTSGNENLLMAGIGANYALNEANNLFGGVYRGASPAGPQAYLTNKTDAEESTGYELGVRHHKDALNMEVAAFYTDFSNIISTDAGFGGAGASPSSNAGEAAVFGFESMVQYDPARARGSSFGLPMYVSATWTSAEFKGTTAGFSGGGDGIYAGGADGNEIPYIPEWKLSAGIGFHTGKWGVNLDGSFASETWGTGYNGDARSGTQTTRDGSIPSLVLFDLSGFHQLNENLRLVAGVQNLLDRQEIVSRVPDGPRANAPRMIYAGFEASF